MKRPRGIALLVVLWSCTLLAILLGGYAALARTEGQQTRYAFDATRAHYAAEAALAQALYALQDPRPDHRWRADGRSYTLVFEDAKVTVSVQDEGGRVDLNSASVPVLAAFFQAAGSAPDAAQQLARAVDAWRRPLPVDNDAALAPDAAPAPRHAPFISLEELQQVPGMDAALYQRMAGDITLWSGRESPDPATASPLAMAAIPGMTPVQQAQLLAARQDNTVPLSTGNGITQSIRAEARMPDGARAVLRATIRQQGMRPGVQPYAVMHWQEGDE